MEFMQSVTAYILSTEADKHIDWMKDVLGGVERFMFRSEDSKSVAHAAVAINGGCLFITDVSYEKAVNAINPVNVSVGKGESDGAAGADGPRGFILHLEVADPDTIWGKAMSTGCTVVMELKDQSWGGYYGLFRDPFGFPWGLMKVSEEKRKRGVVPYILTPGGGGECGKQVEWLKAAYGAEEKERWCTDDGSGIKHCSIELNGCTMYLADQIDLESLHGKPRYFHCHLELPNHKEVWDKALQNDAKAIVDLKMQFWGGVQGTLEDKFGYRWSLSPVSSGPTNSPGVVAYLLSPDSQKHIDFIKKVFDGKVRSLYHTSDEKKIMHCSMEVNGGELCLCDQLCVGEHAEWPKQGEPCGFMCHLDLSNPDAIWKKAMDNGCTQVIELKQQFWGDYYGVFKDPLGYGWSLRKET